MPTAEQTRAATSLVVASALDEMRSLIRAMRSPDQGRHLAFSTVPSVIDHYGSGAAALAVDAYEDRRAAVGVTEPFEAHPYVIGDEAALFNAIAWATDPLYTPEGFESVDIELERRFRDIVSSGITGAGRTTTIQNLNRDPAGLGWRRVTGGHGCDFCRMLASRGAVYRKEVTATFAAHDNCDCIAEAFFQGEKVREANVMQYMASKRTRTRAEKDALNEYVRDWSDDVL